MTDLTKEHFDKQVTQLLDRIATRDEVEKHFAAIEKTLDSHTTTLDGHTKMLIDLTTDKAALQLRLARYDKFMKIVADKLNLDLNKLLNS